MVAAALCIPCMTAAASAGPAAPLVLGASTIGAAGYYSLKKSKMKKRKKKHIKTKKRRKKKSKQRGGSLKNKSKKCCKCHYVKSNKTIRRVKGPYEHCSYDSDNCCKDKKTIVKSKN